MTDHHPNNTTHEPTLPEGLPLGALLRARADGEALHPDDARRLDERDTAERAEDERRLRFERSLREAVAQTIGAAPDAQAPSGLHAAVLDAIRAEPADGVIRSGRGDTRSRSFWAGTAGRLVAAAAVLALAAGLVYTSLSSAGGPMSAQHASLVASFVDQQHESCPLSPKFTAKSPDEARDLTAARVGRAPDRFVAEIDALERRGYRFAGLGACKVPGDQPSVHLYFRSATEGGPHISLFIQANTSQVHAAENLCYFRACDKAGPNTLIMWREGPLLHYLCSACEEALAAAREAFGAPGQLKPLR